MDGGCITFFGVVSAWYNILFFRRGKACLARAPASCPRNGLLRGWGTGEASLAPTGATPKFCDAPMDGFEMLR